MEDLLDTLNAHGFAFTRDFVLKTCLVLLSHGARYEVGKFRKPGVREEIQEKWDAISDAVRDVLDFVRGKTFIQCDNVATDRESGDERALRTFVRKAASPVRRALTRTTGVDVGTRRRVAPSVDSLA
jgi:hypothetical protein